jgi:DNA uptake protein ComE-like DNA-binding protein
MPNLDRDKTIADDPTQSQQIVPRVGPHDVSQSSGSIDLNRASESESEIAEIDMIGKKLARSIVEHRIAAGGFRSWDELSQVPGLDAMKIAELQRASRLGSVRC